MIKYILFSVMSDGFITYMYHTH